MGVDVKTIQSWIGILENSFIIYLLKAHHKNFKKSIVKRPKIYFYDSAIVCYLLGIRNDSQLSTHPLRGSIFEGMVITELIKKRTNAGLAINLYYWRDKTGQEIDIIVDRAGHLIPIEIKSGMTFQSGFFKSIDYWSKLSGSSRSVLLYAGKQNQTRSDGKEIMNWRKGINAEL